MPRHSVASVADEVLFTVVGSAAVPAEPISLVDAGLKERAVLQEQVISHPEILGSGVKVVTFEFGAVRAPRVGLNWIFGSRAVEGDRMEVEEFVLEPLKIRVQICAVSVVRSVEMCEHPFLDKGRDNQCAEGQLEGHARRPNFGPKDSIDSFQAWRIALG
jgi:hypothetical protein